ncbi:MAG: DUF3616 domain-containing protein, partial [Gemmatimonadetes bacterium]|nr:DUF3616 domain-containing protein [Gemmatimonadota bacterium]
CTLRIRDVQFHESDLLILAGPTIDVDGPAAVYRWKKPLERLVRASPPKGQSRPGSLPRAADLLIIEPPHLFTPLLRPEARSKRRAPPDLLA